MQNPAKISASIKLKRRFILESVLIRYQCKIAKYTKSHLLGKVELPMFYYRLPSNVIQKTRSQFLVDADLLVFFIVFLLLSHMVFLVRFCTMYLIISIPDMCRLFYFDAH